MRVICLWALNLALLASAAAAQSLGDFARKERERKAQEQKSSVKVSTDELKTGKLDLSPRLDPRRKSDLDYLLQQLSHPKASAELLAAFAPLKEQAVPRLLPLLGSTDPLKRVAPATTLMVLGNTEGLGAIARLLNDAVDAQNAAAAPGQAQEAGKVPSGKETPAAPSPGPTSDEQLRRRIQASRIYGYAFDGAKLGIWRFTEGRSLAPEQVVQHLQAGPAVEIVGGVDNGQRIFNRALRDPDANLRRAAIALIRVASGGIDYGFRPDQPPDENESAIQQITSFLTTERGKVTSQLGAKNQ